MKVFDTLTREMKKFFWSMAHLGCNSRLYTAAPASHAGLRFGPLRPRSPRALGPDVAILELPCTSARGRTRSAFPKRTPPVRPEGFAFMLSCH